MVPDVMVCEVNWNIMPENHAIKNDFKVNFTKQITPNLSYLLKNLQNPSLHHEVPTIT